MTGEIISVETQPMLHVTRSASMEPGDIARVTSEGFGQVGSLLDAAGIKPDGPPLCVYRDWDGSMMKIDIGFPVGKSDASQASGALMSGSTPAGKALRKVHQGSYSGLQKTYEAMEAHIRDAGLKATGIAWEVYVNDPQQTPEADLVTEVYMTLE